MTVFIEPCSCLFISSSFQDATSSSFYSWFSLYLFIPLLALSKSHVLKFSFRGSSRELKGDFAPFISCSFHFIILFCTQWACLSISMIGWVSRDSTAPAHVYILVENWDHWLWLRRIIHLRLACYQYVNVLISLFGLVVSLSYSEAFYQVPVSSWVWNASHWFTVWSIRSNFEIFSVARLFGTKHCIWYLVLIESPLPVHFTFMLSCIIWLWSRCTSDHKAEYYQAYMLYTTMGWEARWHDSGLHRRNESNHDCQCVLCCRMVWSRTKLWLQCMYPVIHLRWYIGLCYESLHKTHESWLTFERSFGLVHIKDLLDGAS